MTTEVANPAAKTSVQAQPAARKRVPMSTPVSKLSVPEIPGYVLYWFRGDPGRIQRALNGGYEYVEAHEVAINSRELGSNAAKSGNTSLGSRVSLATGDGTGGDGQPMCLHLMKIKKELWDEDQAASIGEGSRLDTIRKGLLGGLLGTDGQTAEDRKQTYVDPKRTKLPDFLNKRA